MVHSLLMEKKNYQDIAAVREMRQLYKSKDTTKKIVHVRVKRNKKRKWISWDEYLNVAQNLEKKEQEDLSFNSQ